MIDMTGPLIHWGSSPSARNVRDLINSEAAAIDFDPPYQRGHVWTTEQRVNLVRSMLLGVPVAAIVLNRRGDNEAWAATEGDPDPTHWFAVIDGKQRLTTFRMWFTGELAVPAAWFDGECFDGERPEWVTYPGLSKRGRMLLARAWTVPVAEARLGSLTEEAEVYGLLNSGGTAHTGADLERARAVAAGMVTMTDCHWDLRRAHWTHESRVSRRADGFRWGWALCGAQVVDQYGADRLTVMRDEARAPVDELPVCEVCAFRLVAMTDRESAPAKRQEPRP